MEAHREVTEMEEEDENLTCAKKQRLRHGETVPARSQQLRVQGRGRRYTDELNHQHNTLGTTAQAMPQHHPARSVPGTRERRRRRLYIAGDTKSPEAIRPQIQHGGDLEQEEATGESSQIDR
jgi:hypothetical protein